MKAPEESEKRAAESSGAPETFLDRVTVGEPAPWVTIRAVDETFRPQADASAFWLLMDRQYHAERHEAFHRTAQRLETMQAVQQVSQWSLTFDPATQWVTIHRLRVWRQGKAVDHAHRERLRLLQREENLERLVLDGSVTVVLLFDDVRVRDVLEISYTIRTAPRLFRERFSTFVSVPAAIPLREFHVSVRFLSDRPLQWKGSDGFVPKVREADGETEWVWTAEGVAPEILEPQVPSWHLPARWLQISDCRSWTEVAAEFAAAWPDPDGDAELSRFVDEIASATADPMERVDRAVLAVQDDIRYLSHNIELGGHIPTAPGTVLQRRFGDCKDKSFLLAQAFQRLGIPAHPVLVSTFFRQAVSQLLPTPALFDHCIVEYQMGDQRCWIDPTLLLQGGGALRRQVPDFEIGLPVRPDAVGLDPVPIGSRRDDRYILREIFRPDTTGGSSVLEVSVIATGPCADNLRRSFTGEGPEAVSRNREEFYRQRYEGIKRIGTMQWRDDRATNQFALAESFELPKLIVATHEPNIFAFQCPAHLIHSVLALPGSAPRKFPMEFTPPRQVEHWIEIDFANQMQGSIEPMSVRSEAFQFWQESKRSAVLFAVRTLANVVTPGQFAAHRTAVEKVFSEARMTFWIPGGYPVSRLGRRSATLPAPLPVVSRTPRSAPGGRKGIVPRQIKFEEPAPAESAPRPLSARLGSPAHKAPAFVPSQSTEPSDREPPAPPNHADDSRANRRPRRYRRKESRWSLIVALTAIPVVAVLIYFFLNRAS